MKKLYKNPLSREINIATEGVIAASSGLTIDKNSSSTESTILSNKKDDIWGNEGIWK